MAEKESRQGTERRNFLKETAAIAGAAMFAGSALSFAELSARAAQATTADWSKQIGLELYTVRDSMIDSNSYISTLEKVAALGYKEIEPAGGYAGLEPKDFRELLDRLGLSMPSIRVLSKTRTLRSNSMVFRQCSIVGRFAGGGAGFARRVGKNTGRIDAALGRQIR